MQRKEGVLAFTTSSRLARSYISQPSSNPFPLPLTHSLLIEQI